MLPELVLVSSPCFSLAARVPRVRLALAMFFDALSSVA